MAATTLGGILAASVVAGIWPVTGTATTWFPVLAVPPALGLPSLLPPLRLTPLGETTWAFWAADTAGAVVMLAVAVVQLRHVTSRRPQPGPGRAFSRGLWTTVLAVVGGNLVRSVFLSVVTHAGLGTYAGAVVGGAVVSALTGALIGVVVGLAAAVAAATGSRRPARTRA
ncbi:hypothetical protein GCM10009809_11480 [Isoptericola hypogeus]|uniref:DUF4126 domain-containing protein n=1 Tax=Isoptericola hypogeus TaxID=300179 RepID=A0ABN2J3F5_9MICO